MKPYSLLAVITLVIPFLALGYMAYDAQTTRKQTPGYIVKITGYDPRDMLRGHYITFRYDWGAPEGPQQRCSFNNTCCAYFSGEYKNPNIRLGLCGHERPDEKSLILGHDYQPESKHRRFYVPELEAPMLEDLLRRNTAQFSIELGVMPNGTPLVKQLYVDGKPLDEFLR